MKKITLLIMFIYTLIFADLDKNAYTNYIKTSQYQIASAKPTGNLFTNLYSTYSKEDNILNWRVTLKKIEDLTGNSTSFGAIAKAYHKNFLYLTLTPVLKDSHNNEICRCTTIQRKIMFGKSNKVSFSSIIPSNITPHHVTIDIGLIDDMSNKKTSLKKPKDKVSKEARQAQEQKREQYRKEVKILTKQASPKSFNSLGDELEKFKNDCNTFQKITHLPMNIKKKCKIYNSQVKKAFSVGYSLDPYIDSDKINEKKLNKYLTLLRKLDKSKEDISKLIYSEIIKARKHKDIKYYSQLITNNEIKLYSSDYEFMENNRNIFDTNKRYLSHIQYKKDLAEQRKNQPKEDSQSNDNTQIHKQENKNKVMTPIHSARSIIIQNCKKKWGTNYRMVKYCIKQQQQALNYVAAVSNGGIIKQQCQSKWGTNYRMVKYCIGQQQQAFNYLENISNSRTKQHCENKWGTNYRMVKYCMDK